MKPRKARNGLGIAAAVILCSYLLPASLAWPASPQSLWIGNYGYDIVIQLKPSIGVSSYPAGVAFDKSGNEWVTVGLTEVEEFTTAQLKSLARAPSPTSPMIGTLSADSANISRIS